MLTYAVTLKICLLFRGMREYVVSNQAVGATAEDGASAWTMNVEAAPEFTVKSAEESRVATARSVGKSVDTWTAPMEDPTMVTAKQASARELVETGDRDAVTTLPYDL